MEACLDQSVCPLELGAGLGPCKSIMIGEGGMSVEETTLQYTSALFKFSINSLDTKASNAWSF